MAIIIHIITTNHCKISPTSWLIGYVLIICVLALLVIFRENAYFCTHNRAAHARWRCDYTNDDNDDQFTIQSNKPFINLNFFSKA